MLAGDVLFGKSQDCFGLGQRGFLMNERSVGGGEIGAGLFDFHCESLWIDDGENVRLA